MRHNCIISCFSHEFSPRISMILVILRVMFCSCGVSICCLQKCGFRLCCFSSYSCKFPHRPAPPCRDMLAYVKTRFSILPYMSQKCSDTIGVCLAKTCRTSERLRQSRMRAPTCRPLHVLLGWKVVNAGVAFNGWPICLRLGTP